MRLEPFITLIVTLMYTVEAADNLDVYYPQIKIYVEKSAVDRWKTNSGLTDTNLLKNELKAMFVNTNEFFKSLSKHGNIRVEFGIQNITLMDANILQEYGYSKTNGATSISEFRNWLDPTKYNDNPYDLALLFTGFFMFDRTGAMLGIARIGGVCTHNGLIVMQLTGTGPNTVVLAHELGHAVGSTHDNAQYSDLSCNKFANTLMVPQAPVWSSNRFTLSYCSYSDIKGVFQNKNCLKDGADNVATGNLFGSLITPDDLCRRQTGGSDTYLDRSRYDTYPANFCLTMYCKGKVRQTVASTPQGFRCGKNKICKLGKCVEDVLGSPLTPDTCPFGDQPRIGKDYDKKCAEIKPSECETYKKECCLSCDATNPLYTMTGDEACKSLDGSDSNFIRSVYRTYGDKMCVNIVCSKNKKGEKFVYNRYPTPDGFACGKNKRCLRGKCTATNHGNPKVTSDSCPFGDQDTKALNYSKTCAGYAVKSCKLWGPTCCMSCQGKY